MKKYILMLLVCAVFVACKSHKEASASTSKAVAAGTSVGKVSHRFKSTGCATVISIMIDGSETILIPKDKLAKEFDVDGLEIRFNYHALKMPNPEGCTSGMPAEITDISKK